MHQQFHAREHLQVEVAGAVHAAIRVEAQQFLKFETDPQRLGGQLEQIAKFAVPAHQAQIAIKHGDALAGEIERMLQQIAIVLQRCGRLVDKFERRLARQIAPA